MEPLLRRCVEVRTAIELSFGVVSGVGPGIHVLDGSPRASRGSCFWHGFWHFSASVPTLRYALYRLQLAHAVGECILRLGGSDVLFPNELGEDLLLKLRSIS